MHREAYGSLIEENILVLKFATMGKYGTAEGKFVRNEYVITKWNSKHKILPQEKTTFIVNYKNV